MIRAWHTLAAGLVLGCAGLATAAEAYLEDEQAFKLTPRAVDAQHIELRFDVAPGYHLFRQRISTAAEPDSAALGELQTPPGQREHDANFDQDVEVYRQAVTLVLPLRSPPTAPLKLLVNHQGCADQGLCYPPTVQVLKVSSGAGGVLAIERLSEEQAAAWVPEARATSTAVVGDDGSRFTRVLASRNLLAVAAAFLLAGLLLSLTPCVLPMIPILSSIIVGQGGTASRGQGFALALAYSLGMALVYTAMGMAAGLAGEGLAAALQNAWVLGAFALLLVALSLSMFGVYELQMPASLQSRLTQWSGRLQGGRFAAVFAMGGLSALIVGPCVAAPLAGALVYISRTQDVWLGGAALFSLAAGMSVPLLLMGLSAPTLLPKAGAWMERVKHFFGVLLLAVALWMVSPVLPAWVLMLLLALLLLSVAVYLGAFERLEARTPGRTLAKGLGLGMGALALLQLAGAASGGSDVLQPLRHWGTRAEPAGAALLTQGAPRFDSVDSLPALERAVVASAQPVLVDFYADWCTACKEMEALTFSDAAVRQRMAGFKLLRVDVTANTAEHKALMRKYSLFGPPALLFFAPAGAELAAERVVGFKNAAEFGSQLQRLQAGSM